MTYLRTPYHPCQQYYATPSGPVRCPFAAHKRAHGLFYCRAHRRERLKPATTKGAA